MSLDEQTPPDAVALPQWGLELVIDESLPRTIQGQLIDAQGQQMADPPEALRRILEQWIDYGVSQRQLSATADYEALAQETDTVMLEQCADTYLAPARVRLIRNDAAGNVITEVF